MPFAVLEGEIAALIECVGDSELLTACAHLADTDSSDDLALIRGELQRRGLSC